MLAVSGVGQEEEEEWDWEEDARVAIPRQLRYLIAHAKLKLNYLPTERVGQPLFQSRPQFQPPFPSPSCPSLSLSLLSFQSDCFRGCLCVPQIGFLLCRTALRIEFELIPLTRPADLRALT